VNCEALRFRRPDQRGAALIITLWVALGLVALGLYFGQSMSLELRASENRVASLAADHAIVGAARYVGTLLNTNTTTWGTLPDRLSYREEAVAVGDSHFWLIGRDSQTASPTEPYFGLVDESSKLNLNTATIDMLEALPLMTPEIAAAIIDWRDTNSDITTGGAEDDTYLRFNPPYHCKNSDFETVDELRLVAGMTLALLYGEDSNLNGVMDPNENDGTNLAPDDNRDGKLDPGFWEYLTVYSQQPNTNADGTVRINLTAPNSRQGLQSLLNDKLGQSRADEIVRRLGPPNRPIGSPLELFITGAMTTSEFTLIEDSLTTTNGASAKGLVNINTASQAVLNCIPGIGVDKAASVVAYRQANAGNLTTVSWIASVLDQASAIQAGPYITGRTFQFSADIAAVGKQGRGFRRQRFVFDTSSGVPSIVFRQDLSHLGWPLGRRTRQNLPTLASIP
jgi:DNA uptake protein ComE-like DNA-binding protein